MTIEEIIPNLEIYTSESIINKYKPEEIKSAIEVGRNKLWTDEQEYVKRRVAEGTDYKSARKSGQKYFEKKRERFNKKANEIENLLQGKPSEAVIKTIRAKIVSIIKKYKFPVQKTHTTSIRGWTETSSGIRVSAEPSYHPYEYVMVEYYIKTLVSSPSEERLKTARDQLDIIKKEAESFGYKVKIVNRGLEVRP